MLIPQLKPTVSKKSLSNIKKVCKTPSLLMGKHFSKLCESWLKENIYPDAEVMLTTSGTRALELIAYALNLSPEDEIIVPSYTFVGSINPFVAKGASPVFVDIDENTLSLNISKLQKAITKRTKAIIVVHYNGLGPHIQEVLRIAQSNNIVLIEDNAQGFNCSSGGQKLGTFGDFSILSFNYTKNVQCGEGGALIVNNNSYLSEIEKYYELGTNRKDFLAGKINHYEWVSIGGKFFPSQLQAAFLYPQLCESFEKIAKRIKKWEFYYRNIAASPILTAHLKLPVIHENCSHNAHIFYVLLRQPEKRNDFLNFLKANQIIAAPHYAALHTSKYISESGKSFRNPVSTKVSESIVRLPMYNGIKKTEIQQVIETMERYFTQEEK
jgi:dTDP-4-amino-4,6-dideoxygalactose transaminase